MGLTQRQCSLRLTKPADITSVTCPRRQPKNSASRCRDRADTLSLRRHPLPSLPLKEFRAYAPAHALCADQRRAPLCAGKRAPARAHRPRPAAGLLLRPHLRRRHRLCGPARRPHGCRLHPYCGALDLGAAGARQILDPGEQHRADHRQRRPVHCRRRHLHSARAHLSRLRPRILAHLHPGAAGRLDRRSLHDSPAPPAHRGGTRQPDLPRGHRLRRCAAGRRARRLLCEPRVPGPGPRRGLHALSE